MINEFYEAVPDVAGDIEEAPAIAHVVLRPYDLDDAKFLMHSWLRSMRGMFRDSTDDDYYSGVQQDIMSLAKCAKVIVACDREKPWFIYGYCVADEAASREDPLVVHYIFVKNAYRRQGIGTAMMKAHGWYPDRIVMATFWNYYLKQLRHVVRLRYNPWYLRHSIHD